MRRISLVTVGLTWLALAAVPAANQWPQFRGSDAGVASDHPALPHSWSETENVVWKVDIPGLGWSSPVVWGDHIFVTTAISAGEEPQPVKGLYDPGDVHGKTDAVAAQRWMVYDIDFETGELRWQQELHEAVPTIKRHLKASFASETPVTDGERVYVYFGSIGLVVALDMTGTIVWSRDLGAFNGHQEFAPAASPVLHEDRLFVVNDNTTESFLIALDTATGDTVWRVVREETENWSTPMVWENDLRTEIITTGKNMVRSYDPSGNLLWYFSSQMTDVTIPTPVPGDGIVYVSSGYVGNNHRPVYAVLPGAEGDITLNPNQQANEYIRWYQPRVGAYNPSPILYRGIYYTLLDGGFLTAHDARTGQPVYGRVRIEPGATFTSSPWAYNGKIFALSEDGDTYVIRAGPDYELLGKNIIGEMTLASPAIAGRTLVLRTASHVYGIRR